MGSRGYFVLGIIAFVIQALSAKTFDDDFLCQNDSGVIKYSEPYDVSDTTATWKIQRNCTSHDSAIVVHVKNLQIQAFEAEAAVLRLQDYRIDEMSIGTCYIYQQHYSMCKNVVVQHSKGCKKFIWMYGEVDSINIDLRRVLAHPISVEINYTTVKCEPGIPEEPIGSVQPIATIALGVVLAIVILLLLILIIRQFKQTAIRAIAEKKTGFEAFDGEYDEDPYQHYQVPSNRPLGRYELDLETVEENHYEVPTVTGNTGGEYGLSSKEAVVYAKPNKEKTGYGALE